jgi:hypothetical protein
MARAQMRSLRLDCGTAALAGATASAALATVALQALPDGTGQAQLAPRIQGGVAAAGCMGVALSARALLGRYVSRTEQATQDAQASELRLQLQQLILEHRPAWGSRLRCLRMQEQGATLEASADRDLASRTMSWSQGPDRSRASAGEAVLDIDSELACLRAGIGHDEKLELREPRLRVGRGPACNLSLNRAGRISLDACRVNLRPGMLLDIG